MLSGVSNVVSRADFFELQVLPGMPSCDSRRMGALRSLLVECWVVPARSLSLSRDRAYFAYISQALLYRALSLASLDNHC